MGDTITLHELTLTAHIGDDWWGRSRPQPILLTVHVHTDLAQAGASDDVRHTIHYGHLASAILALQAPERVFPSLADLAEAAADAALSPKFEGVDSVRVVVEAPKLLLQAQGLGVDITRPTAKRDTSDKIYIKDLTTAIIIGVNPPERVSKQLVVTNIAFHNPSSAFPHAAVVQRLTEHIEGTKFLTLEAFVASVAHVASAFDGMDSVTVRAQKPSAVSFGHSSGVEITRNRAFFKGNPA